MATPGIGLIGLAVMGENLALNIANHGFPIAVYNRTRAVTEQYVAHRTAGKPVTPAYTLEEFVRTIARPRSIAIMVQAGKPVDSVLDQLLPLLGPDDLVMDCGNSYFEDTARRSAAIAPTGIHYFGVGVSGGEEGALNGPSIMPGGPEAAYPRIAGVLGAIAAKVPDGPCVAYMGTGAAGHYVKMIHNGIEYGDMQLIVEAYDILSHACGFSAIEIGAIFAEWNRGELDSYLVEISAAVLQSVDRDTGRPIVDVILDRAGQKGTGRWTGQDGLELGVPIPTIEAALWGRNISALKAERLAAAKVLKGPRQSRLRGASAERLVAAVRQALYASKIASYAQGMSLLATASAERGYSLNLPEIARIWKGGCIIRARLLNEIQAAFTRDPRLPNLLLDADFRAAINERQAGWRHTVRTAIGLGIPCPAFGSSLAYFDSYRAARLPANLIQGQRDYFGAHTYERVDRNGAFHTEWLVPEASANGARIVTSQPAGRGGGH
ncbi:MAG: NADP-dependent phosphogluconate dehydrogenase [Chloroflexi bacterium]|nr:NADP-dependent phosphogluconate dehydrogenase [Chloroflexota bacterium]